MKLNLIKALGVASVTSIVPFTAISCSSDESAYAKEETFDYSEMDWDAVNYFEVTVQGLSGADGFNDGDTFRFSKENIDLSNHGADSLPPDPENEGEHLTKIRLMGIDTPEMGSTDDDGYTETTGLEREIADAGADFAREVMPNGTRVRVVTPKVMQVTYDRIVGSVWYGDNFEYNWEVEVMKRGLAQPTWTNQQALLNVSATYEALHYTAWPMYYNFNYARDNKIGLFKHDPSDVFKVRGVGVWTVMDSDSNIHITKDSTFQFPE